MSLAPLFDRLAGVSIQTALLVVIVFGLTRWLAISPRVRAGLWTLVFAHALAGMFFAVPLPVYSAPQTRPTTINFQSQEVPAGTPATAPAEPFTLDPKTAIIVIWALGAAVLIFSQLRGERSARRLLSDSLSAGGAIDSLALTVAAEMGIRKLHVRLSSKLVAPCVSGFLRPTVYLPESMRDADEEALRAVFVHELAHVRHGDLPASVLAATARCLFFFHPMTWVAHREWAIHREAACDAEVLRRSKIGLTAYCDLLITFAQGRPLLSATIQTATRGFSHLHRRICEMKNTQPKKRGAAPVATIAALVVSALAAVPVTLTARNAMTHRPEHASGAPHSITQGKDGPTLEVGPDDAVSVMTVDGSEETDPVLATDLTLSLKNVSLDMVISTIEKSANVKIEAPSVKTEPISLDLDSNLRTGLDVAANIANMKWERTGDRSFKLVQQDPEMLDPKHLANPEMIDQKHIADPVMLPEDMVVDAIEPVAARDIIQGNGGNGVHEGVILLFPPDMPSEINLDLTGAPTTPGTYEVTLAKDDKHKTGWRLSYKKTDVKIID